MNRISVVIPLYNRAGWIAETLLSIEKQSLKPFEVIVVNDHSTDASVQVVEDYKKSSGLNIIVLTNGFKKGMCGALNWGIVKAAGERIAMQDSDDLWLPSHLKQLEEALCRHPEVDIAFSAIEVFGPAKDTVQKNKDFSVSVKRCLEHAFKKDGDGLWVSHKDLLFALLMFGFPFRCQASLIRKEFFIKNNFYFDTDITYTLDSQFMTLAAYFTTFLYVDSVGLKFRRHTENDGDAGYGDKIRSSYKIRVDKLKDFFSKHQLTPKESKALEHRLWCLQTQVADIESDGKPLGIRAKTARELIQNVPTWSSVKSSIKLLLGRRINA